LSEKPARVVGCENFTEMVSFFENDLRTEIEFFIDNLLVRIHFIIVMMRWTGLAP